MDADSDDALMARVQKGSQEAFSLLVARHLDALYAYALRLSRQPAVAEDMVQETWLTVWQKARTFNPRKAKLTTWLHRILHNRYIDTLRRDRGQETVSLEETLPGELPDRPAAASLDRLDQLDELINTLPLNQKSAITLTYLQGFSNRETAHIMGLSTRAVESLLVRARESLHATWQSEVDGMNTTEARR